MRNGVLPIILDEDTVSTLAGLAAPATINVDLEAQVITAGSASLAPIRFEVGEFAKRLLVEGLEPIALTMTDQAQIEAFFKRDEMRRPWIYSAA